MEHGPGVALVTGPRLAVLPDGYIRRLLLGLSLVLGHPMAQNPARERVVSVRDDAGSDASARGYRTNAGLLMHTDAADVAGLVCLNQSQSGGATLLASVETVHDALTDECPDLIHEYYRSWEWDRRGLEPSGERPTLRSPIFSCYRGRLNGRYASGLLRKGAVRIGAELTLDQTTALDLFDAVAQRQDLRLEHTLRRGESVWMNNYAVLHGRQSFTDGDELSTRHLLRTWVWLHCKPTLASHFVSPREVY
jgi:hypothetical protein